MPKNKEMMQTGPDEVRMSETPPKTQTKPQRSGGGGFGIATQTRRPRNPQNDWSDDDGCASGCGWFLFLLFLFAVILFIMSGSH